MRSFLIIIKILFITSCNNSIKVQHQEVNSDTSARSIENFNDSIAWIDKPTGITNREEDIFDFEAAFQLENFIISILPDSDYVKINFSCGIFISPDSNQIAQMKNEYGEEDFYILADDNLFYEYEAKNFLQERNIKTIQPTCRYLVFIFKNIKIIFDARSKASSGWITMLFSGKSKPRIINPVDIESEYIEWFSKE